MRQLKTRSLRRIWVTPPFQCVLIIHSMPLGSSGPVHTAISLSLIERDDRKISIPQRISGHIRDMLWSFDLMSGDAK